MSQNVEPRFYQEDNYSSNKGILALFQNKIYMSENPWFLIVKHIKNLSMKQQERQFLNKSERVSLAARHRLERDKL